MINAKGFKNSQEFDLTARTLKDVEVKADELGLIVKLITLALPFSGWNKEKKCFG
jgi:hypothetical protein